MSQVLNFYLVTRLKWLQDFIIKSDFTVEPIGLIMLDICPMSMCWNCGFKFFTSFVDTSRMAFFFVKAFQILNWSNTQWSYWMKLMSVVWTRMCTWILSTWANLKLDSMCFDIHVYCIPIHLLDSCVNYCNMNSCLRCECITLP